MVPSTPLRPRSVAIVGEGAYTAVFSILSLIAIYWLSKQFNIAPYGDKLWFIPGWWPWVQAVLILFSFILMFGGFLTPNPATPVGAQAFENPNLADGIFAITRHPVMWGVAIWAVTHMISQATWRGFVFFGTFAATALIGSWLQQNRKRHTVPGWSAFEAKTSFFPFAAILQGRAKFSLRAIGWKPFAIALIAWVAILHFHFWLFSAY
jgi:uncharacterized membrane protein